MQMSLQGNFRECWRRKKLTCQFFLDGPDSNLSEDSSTIEYSAHALKKEGELYLAVALTSVVQSFLSPKPNSKFSSFQIAQEKGTELLNNYRLIRPFKIDFMFYISLRVHFSTNCTSRFLHKLFLFSFFNSFQINRFMQFFLCTDSFSINFGYKIWNQ